MNIYTVKYSQEKIFYVYQYIRTKKSKYGDIGTPYNVGKGKGRRAFSKQHYIKPPKDKIDIQFISENMNEADAFQLEILLIHLHGRVDLKTGCLRNMTNGGDGASGRILSKESIAKGLKTRQTNNSIETTIAKMIATRKANDSFKKSKESVQKGLATRRSNGTLNVVTSESIAKSLQTRKLNGTIKTCTIKSIAKGVNTRKANDSFKKSKESVEKCLRTKLEKYGTTNSYIIKQLLKDKNA